MSARPTGGEVVLAAVLAVACAHAATAAPPLKTTQVSRADEPGMQALSLIPL